MEHGDAPCGVGILGDSVKSELILVIYIVNLGVVDDEKHIAVAEPVVLVNIRGSCAAIFVRVVDIERISVALAVVVADRGSHGIRSECRRGEGACPFVGSVSVLSLIACGDDEADIVVLVERGAESLLPDIRFFASVLDIAVYLNVADVENFELLCGERSVHNRLAELPVAAVGVVVNGVRLKTCCGHFVYALTRVAVGRCFADKFFERGHVGTLADADNSALCRVVGVPAEVELSRIRTRGECDKRVVVSYSFPVAVPFGLSEHIASVCRSADSKARGKHEQREQNGQRPFCCFH